MNTNTSTGRSSEKFVLRLPDGMRDWIAEEARKNLRSANAQIIWMLQQMKDQGAKRVA